MNLNNFFLRKWAYSKSLLTLYYIFGEDSIDKSKNVLSKFCSSFFSTQEINFISVKGSIGSSLPLRYGTPSRKNSLSLDGNIGFEIIGTNKRGSALDGLFAPKITTSDGLNKNNHNSRNLKNYLLTKIQQDQKTLL